MKDKLKEYVEKEFEHVKQTKEILELKEEVYGNLCDQYEEFIQVGYDKEEAYLETIKSVGSFHKPDSSLAYFTRRTTIVLSIFSIFYALLIPTVFFLIGIYGIIIQLLSVLIYVIFYSVGLFRKLEKLDTKNYYLLKNNLKIHLFYFVTMFIFPISLLFNLGSHYIFYLSFVLIFILLVSYLLIFFIDTLWITEGDYKVLDYIKKHLEIIYMGVVIGIISSYDFFSSLSNYNVNPLYLVLGIGLFLLSLSSLIMKSMTHITKTNLIIRIIAYIYFLGLSILSIYDILYGLNVIILLLPFSILYGISLYLKRQSKAQKITSILNQIGFIGIQFPLILYFVGGLSPFAYLLYFTHTTVYFGPYFYKLFPFVIVVGVLICLLVWIQFKKSPIEQKIIETIKTIFYIFLIDIIHHKLITLFMGNKDTIRSQSAVIPYDIKITLNAYFVMIFITYLIFNKIKVKY